MENKKTNKVNPNKLKTVVVFLALSLIIFSIILINSLNRLESKLMPTFATMCEIQTKQIVGSCIDHAIQKMHDMSIYEPSDFYKVSYDENGNVSLIENNSILINEITNDISYSLDSKLSELGDVSMELKIFDILFPEPLDEFGPIYKMDVMKDGTSNVSYKSEITELGGNQTNFKAYILIEVNVKLLSPIYNKSISIKREVLIVDSIISSKNVSLRVN